MLFVAAAQQEEQPTEAWRWWRRWRHGWWTRRWHGQPAKGATDIYREGRTASPHGQRVEASVTQD